MSNFKEFAKKIEDSIHEAKQMALNRYGQNHSKQDIISDTVATFVLDNIQQIKPRPKLFKNMLAGKHVSINMVLDSIGENGVLIGATAYRIAEQLQIELQDNNVKSKDKPVVPCINGQFVPDLCSNDVAISCAYLKYFRSHDLSILYQNFYLIQQIKYKFSITHPLKEQIASCYIELLNVNNSTTYFRLVHAVLFTLIFGRELDEQFKTLKNIIEAYSECMNEIDDDCNQRLKAIRNTVRRVANSFALVEDKMLEW